MRAANDAFATDDDDEQIMDSISIYNFTINCATSKERSYTRLAMAEMKHTNTCVAKTRLDAGL